MNPLCIREQYKLACRFLRLRLAVDLPGYRQVFIFSSFGITGQALEAAYQSVAGSHIESTGWSTFLRRMEFDDRRERLLNAGDSLAIAASKIDADF